MSGSPESSPFSLAELARLQKNTTPKREISRTQPTEVPTNGPSTEEVALILRKSKSGLEQYEHQLGGRDGVIDCLQLANLDKRQQHFLDLLLDPRRQNDSISLIARDAGLTVTQTADLLRSTSFARSHALGMAKLNDSLPLIAEDLATKSVDLKVECPTCFGAREIPEGVMCPQCSGKGMILRTSELDRQKVVLEATGVIKRGGGMTLNVNQNVGIVQPGNFFSKFVKDSDIEAYKTDAIDAEIVKKEE